MARYRGIYLENIAVSKLTSFRSTNSLPLPIALFLFTVCDLQSMCEYVFFFYFVVQVNDKNVKSIDGQFMPWRTKRFPTRAHKNTR